MILYRLNRILSRKNIFKPLFRTVHDETQPNVIFPLESRRLLKIYGNDASTFLQGLITNDMRHFEDGAKSIYAMFLNNKGRVLYDTLIHKCVGRDAFLLEYDKKISDLIEKHLKVYKLRRIVNFEDVTNEYKLWVLIKSNSKLDSENKLSNNLNIYRDPRLVELGFRILTPPSLRECDLPGIIGENVLVNPDDRGYKYLRYRLGVSEGADDLPPGSCFPLEVNCDYLHGVSFHKGCYIGQELTARVHHTGVVRKRLMPIKFTEKIEGDISKDTVIKDEAKPKSNLGTLKGYINNYGLALLRFKEATEAKTLQVGNYSAEAIKPSWWPVEAIKQPQNTKTDTVN